MVVQLRDLHGCTITLDAMGDQAAIARQIVPQGGEYVLSVKDHQEQVPTERANTWRAVAAAVWVGVAHAHTRTVEAGHGRVATRGAWLSTTPDYLRFLNPKSAWRDGGGSGMVGGQRTVAGVTA